MTELAEGTKAEPFRVQWIGAQRNLLEGDLRGHADLQELARLTHLNAVGPLDGVRGEVTIINGRPSVAHVSAGSVEVESSWNHRACFLVYCEVAHWQPVRVPGGVATGLDLERALPDLGGAVGIDPKTPFPFLIVDETADLGLHVLNKTDGLPHTAALHEAAKVRFHFKKIRVEMIGFHSTAHRSIFTPHNSNVHIHAVAADGAVSGHVDRFTLSATAALFLPA